MVGFFNADCICTLAQGKTNLLFVALRDIHYCVVYLRNDSQHTFSLFSTGVSLIFLIRKLVVKYEVKKTVWLIITQ